MSRGILLSKKYGANPSIAICHICGEETGEIVLPGRLKGDVEAPRRAVWNKEPCKQCKGWMGQGIILISVRDGEAGENPYRTGKIAVVTEAAMRKVITTQDLADDIARKRVCFVPDTVWEQVGLPVGEPCKRRGYE